MTNREVITQNLLNIINSCVAKLHLLNDYTDDELILTDDVIEVLSDSYCKLRSLDITEDIPF